MMWVGLLLVVLVGIVGLVAMAILVARDTIGSGPTPIRIPWRRWRNVRILRQSVFGWRSLRDVVGLLIGRDAIVGGWSFVLLRSSSSFLALLGVLVLSLALVEPTPHAQRRVISVLV